jgi:protein-tyrosine-phosphatase
MWRGFENSLFDYILAMIREADRRGIKTDKNKDNLLNLRVRTISRWGSGIPDWYNNNTIMKRITTTHKANLYRKDDIYYHDFVTAVTDPNNEPCCERCNYYWVTHNG